MTLAGVDLGGTKMAAALLDGRELAESVVRPTNLASSDTLIDQIVEIVHSVGQEGLEAVGVGVPSVVDVVEGLVISSVNVPLADVPLGRVLSERLGVPVFVDNDATVAALAEAHDADLRLVAHNLVMITVGTGIGGGIVIGGRIYRGATGGAGEFGHTIVAADPVGPIPEPESFPQPASLESVASGTALDRLAAEAADQHPASELGRLLAESGEVLGPDAVTAAERGDEAAAAIVAIWGQRLGIGIANAINTFDPDEVVIGGGAAEAGELLLEPARRVAEGYVVPGLGKRTKVRLASHGVRAGVFGAALLALHELNAPAPSSTTEVAQ